MINNYRTEHEKILNYLHSLNHEFYLTGSRFFGGYKDSSDHDFFTEYSEEVERTLIQLGFTKVDPKKSNYKSIDIVCVYTNKGIDVQLVVDAVLKHKIQECLFRMRIGFHEFSKERRRDLWNLMYDLIRSIN